MSFINWSDAEEMLGLLSEYVIDESSESIDDAARCRFLRVLSAEIRALASQASELSVPQAIDQLRAVRDSHLAEFRDDPSVIHIEDCIQELERIRRGARQPAT